MTTTKERLQKLRGQQKDWKRVRYFYQSLLNRQLKACARVRSCCDNSKDLMSLTIHGFRWLMKLDSKVRQAQRMLVENRKKITALELEMSKERLNRKMKREAKESFESWHARLWDTAEGTEVLYLLDADPDSYRPAYEAGKSVSQVLEDEKKNYTNLTINGKKII